jgi:UDP-perosamine 4-acetyltransferase
MKEILILGAGGGGRILSTVVKESSKYKLIGFIDDSDSKQGKEVNGFKVIGKSEDLSKYKGKGFVVGVGTNMQARKELFEKALKAGLEPVNIIHKSAVVDKTAEIGKGIVLLAGVVVNPFAKVGDNVFVFTNSTIEHDNVIGSNVYISPGVHLAGHVTVEDNTFFGINSCVIEKINIGKDVTIGAGAVVLKDVPDSVVVAGTPAKVLRKKN